MLKCSSDRWVCAPHSLSAGTSTSPRLSVSFRICTEFSSLISLIASGPSFRRVRVSCIAFSSASLGFSSTTRQYIDPATIRLRLKLGKHCRPLDSCVDHGRQCSWDASQLFEKLPYEWPNAPLPIVVNTGCSAGRRLMGMPDSLNKITPQGNGDSRSKDQ